MNNLFKGDSPALRLSIYSIIDIEINENLGTKWAEVKADAVNQ